MMIRRALALALLLLAAAPMAGCPSNFCLLTVNGRCEVSTCGAGQAFSDRQQRCVCEANRLPVGGACLTSVEAKQYCGKGAFWGARGCEPIQCRQGDIVDLETEMCVPKAQVDQQAGVGPGKTLACAQGTVLVVSQGQGSCVPVDQSCTRDEFFDPATRVCAKLPVCPTGAVFDQAARGCVQVSQQPAQNDNRTTVDVAQWARSTYGVDGGLGAPGLCGPLARKPLTFGVMPGGSVRLVVSLAMSFPGGLSDGAVVQATTTIEASGQPATARGAQEAQSTADGLMSSLRVQKAHTTAPQLSMSVKCLIVNAEPPQTVPTTGGA
ncbi:MAG: hypothetical protein EOO75_01305 [Myxococcales bacterium]|nr:MAG: hypothetical protein EOO75_01305 [Myxococcales bacterium]